MREIKFRAWDDVEGLMVYSDSDSEYSFFTFDKGKIIAASIYEQASGSDYEPDYKCSRELENIMQFTGLKDRNGREIYEGDIYRVDAEDALCGTYPVVVDETHGMRFMLGKSVICKADAIYGEVIGNVYESPEMVKP